MTIPATFKAALGGVHGDVTQPVLGNRLVSSNVADPTVFKSVKDPDMYLFTGRQPFDDWSTTTVVGLSDKGHYGRRIGLAWTNSDGPSAPVNGKQLYPTPRTPATINGLAVATSKLSVSASIDDLFEVCLTFTPHDAPHTFSLTEFFKRLSTDESKRILAGSVFYVQPSYVFHQDEGPQKRCIEKYAQVINLLSQPQPNKPRLEHAIILLSSLMIDLTTALENDKLTWKPTATDLLKESTDLHSMLTQKPRNRWS